jgi:hypothetical protein
MSAISRGFVGRRTTAVVKLPPGQYVTDGSFGAPNKLNRSS